MGVYLVYRDDPTAVVWCRWCCGGLSWEREVSDWVSTSLPFQTVREVCLNCLN